MMERLATRRREIFYCVHKAEEPEELVSAGEGHD